MQVLVSSDNKAKYMMLKTSCCLVAYVYWSMTFYYRTSSHVLSQHPTHMLGEVGFRMLEVAVAQVAGLS